jgi:alkylresorcinol/alkylpyrone synthase
MHSASTQAPSPLIRAVGHGLPPHYATQEQLISALRELWARKHFHIERLEELHRAVNVSGRFLALPIEAYPPLVSFQQRNDAWIRSSVELGEKVVRQALEKAGLSPEDVDHVFFVTVTGLAVPSIEARLVNRLGFREDVRRTPIFGLGCVAGAAGVARATDYLRAYPHHTALLLSVELCSLTTSSPRASSGMAPRAWCCEARKRARRDRG